MASQGFFSYGDNFGEQIASNFDDYTIEDKKNVINFQKKLQNDPNYTPKPYESESLRRQMKAEDETFSPRGNEVAKFASVGSPRVQLASVKSYIDSDTKPYAPDDVGDYIRDSETQKTPTYGEGIEKAINNLDSYDKRIINKATQEYGVPMSKEEKRATTAYTLANSDKFGGYYKFPDTNYDKIQSDYDKYQPLRDRRVFRKGVEDNLSDFRSDYMKDFRDADYAIKMRRYNKDGTENELNKYNLTRDQYTERLTDLRDFNEITAMRGEGINNAMDRYGNLMTSEEKRKLEQKIAAEEAERTILSKLQARKNYEDSQKTILQRVGDFLGGAFNAVTGTQAARGDVLDGRINFNNSVPNISTFSGTGDPSFRSYRLGEDFSNLIRGVGNLPAQDTSFSSYVRGAQPGQERGNTRLQEARNIARRNPNVSINEKTGRAEATNNSGRARAQAMAVNRKLSGKSMSQVKSENKQAMKDRAKARHAAFKKKRAEKKKNKKK